MRIRYESLACFSCFRVSIVVSIFLVILPFIYIDSASEPDKIPAFLAVGPRKQSVNTIDVNLQLIPFDSSLVSSVRLLSFSAISSMYR